jgi:hypothetical protein
MTPALALLLAAASLDWPQVVERFPNLKSFAPAATIYGDGVVRADLTGGCEKHCEGPGLPWSEFVSLKLSAAATRVVEPQAKPVAELYLTEAACASGTSDLAPDFIGDEPAR